MHENSSLIQNFPSKSNFPWIITEIGHLSGRCRSYMTYSLWKRVKSCLLIAGRLLDIPPPPQDTMTYFNLYMLWIYTQGRSFNDILIFWEQTFIKMKDKDLKNNQLDYCFRYSSSSRKCSGLCKAGIVMSWCRDLGKPRGVGKLEWGWNREGRGGGGQFTSSLGPGWTGSHHTKGGIPSK